MLLSMMLRKTYYSKGKIKLNKEPNSEKTFFSGKDPSLLPSFPSSQVLPFP